jgi:hypothetical protein
VGFRTGVSVVANRYLFMLLLIICVTALSVAKIIERWLMSNWRVLCGSTPSWVVIDFSMQFACALLSSVACQALQHFSILSHKWHDFKKKVIVYEMCVLIFSATFV